MQNQFTVILDACVLYNAPNQLEAQHPDDFLRNQLDLYPALFLSSIKTIRSRLKNPPRTAQEYLFNLFQHAPQTVNILQSYVDLI